MTNRLRIGEVAAATGVPASTIRYYERAGVLPEPARVNGQRAYQEDVIEDLGAIRMAQELGFDLADIRALLGEFRRGGRPSEECRELARQKLAELDQLTSNAEKMKAILEHGVSCTCTSLQGCYIGSADSA